MIVCCAFIHSRIPGFWDLGIVYLCFQFLGIPFEFLIYYGAKFRNRWFLGLWLVLLCFKLITYSTLKNHLNLERYLEKKCRAHCTFNCNCNEFIACKILTIFLTICFRDFSLRFFFTKVFDDFFDEFFDQFFYEILLRIF